MPCSRNPLHAQGRNALWRSLQPLRVFQQDRSRFQTAGGHAFHAVFSHRHPSGPSAHGLFELRSRRAKRFAHTDQLRSDKAIHVMLGIERFPGTDTVRSLFARFTQGSIEAFWRRGRIWLQCCPAGKHANAIRSECFGDGSALDVR
jgi:hypothetical protein